MNALMIAKGSAHTRCEPVWRMKPRAKDEIEIRFAAVVRLPERIEMMIQYYRTADFLDGNQRVVRMADYRWCEIAALIEEIV